MKAFFAALALVTSVSSVSFALVSPATAEFNQVAVDANLGLGEIIGGGVTVDLEAKKITLSLQPAMPPCPAGMACIQVMPQPKRITLPIVKVTKSFCGDVYLAKIDQRPVDGILRQITLTDYTTATCEKYIQNLVEVEYETAGYNRMEGKETLTKSYFTAPKFN